MPQGQRCLLICLLFPHVSGSASVCDETSLLQQTGLQEPSEPDASVLPFNQHLEAERPKDLLSLPTRLARDWSSARDLATVGPVHKFTWTPRENHSYELLFFSAVPSFGPHGNFIALLHDLWTDSNPDEFLKALKEYPLYCSGADGQHKSQLRVYGWDHGEKGTQVSVNFLCDWPARASQHKSFEVFLEDAHGKAIGSLVAEHKPELFNRTYGTAACVREIYLTNQSNAPFKLLPEWMEFHAMHGIEHFFVYTFDYSDPGMEALLTPYINSGLATRVHIKQYPERRVRHHRLMTDCLFRAKSRAQWLLPTFDTDEYLQPSPKVFGGDKVPENYLEVLWDATLDHFKAKRKEVHSLNLEFFRFARSARSSVEISSQRRMSTNNRDNEGRTKYVVNLENVHGIWIHFPTNWDEGTYGINVPRGLIAGHHYRYEDQVLYGDNDTDANITDRSLASKAPALEKALEQRYGVPGHASEFLEHLSHLAPKTDVEIFEETSEGDEDKMDPLDAATYEKDVQRKAAAVARGQENPGGASLHKEMQNKLARLTKRFYGDGDGSATLPAFLRLRQTGARVTRKLRRASPAASLVP